MSHLKDFCNRRGMDSRVEEEIHWAYLCENVCWLEPVLNMLLQTTLQEHHEFKKDWNTKWNVYRKQLLM